MKKMRMFAAVVCVVMMVFQFALLAFAQGNADEAKALVEKAASFYQENGHDKAVAAFNDPKGEFVNGELYIFMFDNNGMCIAHGYNPKLVGKDLSELKDANGVLFIQEFAKKVKAGGGWVDYQWTNPITKKVQDKSSYVKGLDGTDYYVGCGIYK